MYKIWILGIFGLLMLGRMIAIVIDEYKKQEPMDYERQDFEAW